jgi:hypothetical protein
MLLYFNRNIGWHSSEVTEMHGTVCLGVVIPHGWAPFSYCSGLPIRSGCGLWGGGGGLGFWNNGCPKTPCVLSCSIAVLPIFAGRTPYLFGIISRYRATKGWARAETRGVCHFDMDNRCSDMCSWTSPKNHGCRQEALAGHPCWIPATVSNTKLFLTCSWKSCQIKHLHPLLCTRNTANMTTMSICPCTSI